MLQNILNGILFNYTEIMGWWCAGLQERPDLLIFLKKFKNLLSKHLAAYYKYLSILYVPEFNTKDHLELMSRNWMCSAEMVGRFILQ